MKRQASCCSSLQTRTAKGAEGNENKKQQLAACESPAPELAVDSHRLVRSAPPPIRAKIGRARTASPSCSVLPLLNIFLPVHFALNKGRVLRISGCRAFFASARRRWRESQARAHHRWPRSGPRTSRCATQRE